MLRLALRFEFVVLLSMVGCATSKHTGSPFPETPVIGKRSDGRPIHLGGFSSLACAPEQKEGPTILLVTNTDRGPNSEPHFVPGDKRLRRPFFKPNFQPRLVYFEWNRSTGEITLTKELLLTKHDGTPLTGLPNNAEDELPVDMKDQDVPFDPLGLDLEGLVFNEDGSFWMADEYGPSLVHFSEEGRLLRRLLPKRPVGAAFRGGEYAFSGEFILRKLNRGFEGVARAGDRIYAFLQSPLEGVHSGRVSVLVWDLMQDRAIETPDYPFERGRADKIGDVAGLADGSLLVLEQDGNADITSERAIYRVWFEATGIRKELVLDLTKEGYFSQEKIEGILPIDSRTLLTLSDDDFGVSVSDGRSELRAFRLKKALPVLKCGH